MTKRFDVRTAALMAAMLAAAVITSATGDGEPVAMVTDVTGRVVLDVVKEGAELALLTEVQAGSRIQLAPNATLVLVFFESGQEYAYAGPSRIQIGEREPELLDGSAPSVRAILGDQTLRIRPAGKAQASVRMRGRKESKKIELLAPVDARILEVRPAFSWQPVEAAGSYRFELMDDEMNLVAEARTEASSCELPAHVELEEGRIYTWEVETRLEGLRLSSWTEFTVATAADRALIAQLDPGPDASRSQKVVFATWLRQEGYSHLADSLLEEITAGS
jgi:hypothetical protein